MSKDFTRRQLLRTSAAATTGLGVIGTASADETGEAPEVTGKIPCLDLTDAEDRTTTISSEPLPDHATGIRPGSQMFIEYPDGTTAGCTANFIWRDTSTVVGEDEDDDDDVNEGGADDDSEESPVFEEEEPDGPHPIYIGAAGHCFLPGGNTANDEAGEDFENTYDVSELTVKVCKDCNVGGITGLSVIRGDVYELGEVEYARQALPNDDGGEGEEVGHDFGLVRIPEELRKAVDPSLPQFGGPIDVEDGAVPEGETVCQYGAGVGNGEVFPTMATRGLSEGDLGSPESWYAGLRATPGDSGSPLEEYEFGSGTDAAGILTHLTTVGVAGTTIPRCIQMPKDDGVDLDLEVVRATEDVTR